MKNAEPLKIGVKVVRHSRYITFQMAKIAINKKLFAEILFRIDDQKIAMLF